MQEKMKIWGLHALVGWSALLTLAMLYVTLAGSTRLPAWLCWTGVAGWCLTTCGVYAVAVRRTIRYKLRQGLTNAAVRLLNEMLILDPRVMEKLINTRLPVNEQLAEHPDLVFTMLPCDADAVDLFPHLGALGVVNGIMRAAGAPLVAVGYNSTHMPLRFGDLEVERRRMGDKFNLVLPHRHGGPKCNCAAK